MPKWALPTLAVIMIAIFTYLGFWQLDRARERQSDFEAKKAQLEQKTLVLKQGDDLDTLKPYQQVSVEGRLIPSSTILLDNAILNGRAGYQVVTAFKPDVLPLYIPVKRGWLPSTGDRNRPPTVNTPQHTITLTGHITLFPEKPLFFSDRNLASHHHAEAPPVWLYFDSTEFSQRLALPLAPFILLASPDQPGAFQVSPPSLESKQGMHIGYAIQWFAFAVFVIILSFGAFFKQRHKKEVHKPIDR